MPQLVPPKHSAISRFHLALNTLSADPHSPKGPRNDMFLEWKTIGQTKGHRRSGVPTLYIYGWSRNLPSALDLTI